ncbi:MAG: amidohydrolase [Acidobacteriota bacterium]|jgi:aminobenzoyl-glutamate utilization protein B
MKTKRVAFSLLVSLLAAFSATAQRPDGGTQIIEGIEAKHQAYADVALQIWKFAETGYQEVKSSALLEAKLAEAGFTVQKGVADIPTAFVANYGSGKPVIAFIGEYDALPGLSQEAVPEKKPVLAGAPGHGCGHNLLGTAAMAAAIAVKDWMASAHREGTVRFYGTPAEEGGSGKVYMVRAGLFKDVDVAVSWHPGDSNRASASSNLANISAKFRFHGIASHAAAAPEKGRSALEAVEAMDMMVNMMRQHVPQETRIHYIITGGGAAPNVVPDFAEAYYVARNPDMKVLDGIWQRIVDAAKGAALGTGTTMDMEIVGGTYNILPNSYLAGLQNQNLQRLGGIKYTNEERAFAEALRRTMLDPALPLGSEEKILSPDPNITPASTDLGDVSWNVPTIGLTTATWVPGTSAHTWQATACDGMSIGIKGMMLAAKTMALTGLDLFTDPTHIQKARAEFEQRRGNYSYKPIIGDRKPPLDYRK